MGFFHWHLRVHEAEATSKLNKIAGKAAGPRRVRCHKHRRQAPGERTSATDRWLEDDLAGWKFGNHTVDGSEIPRPTTWDVSNFVNNGIFTISTGAGFQPSTVVFPSKAPRSSYLQYVKHP